MTLGNNLRKKNKESSTTDKREASVEKLAGKTAENKLKEDQNATEEDIPSTSESDERKIEKLNEDVEKINIADGNIMMIVFPIENEEYAIAIDMVKEVVKIPAITPIPQAPNYIIGVANVRGNVIAILDLGLKLGVSDIQKENSSEYILVINDDEYKVAIAINKVPDTLIVKKSEMGQSSNLMVQSSQDQTYIKSVIKKDERMIIWIDVLEMITGSEAVKI